MHLPNSTKSAGSAIEDDFALKAEVMIVNFYLISHTGWLVDWMISRKMQM